MTVNKNIVDIDKRVTLLSQLITVSSMPTGSDLINVRTGNVFYKRPKTTYT